ncbi:hypothetical protein GCM10025857_28700 [Alicyclobacillus contaminans]|uniref:hypothetical protein n=1 Tax=Alicyclobacillus contaminans TaxID=392016 RepID=UPI00040EBF6B|nr:hypothetical protein [Alicyclobacillus contaminans]GMA51513.1 hypothetical protein GCM10025857_28700 [Alicyclobacillus contaminans]
MNPLERYVDRLFAKHQLTPEIRELRDEILTNLEARVSDLVTSGCTDAEALAIAVNSIPDVHFLIGSHVYIRVDPYIQEVTQIGVLYLTIAWVCTIPLRVFPLGIIANSLLMVLLVAAGILYLSLILSKHPKQSMVKCIDVNKAKRVRNGVWWLWSLYLAMSTAFTFGTRFASNLWFHRPVQMDGPYQLASVAVPFLLPFVTVIVPLFATSAYRFLHLHKVVEP